MAIYVALRDRLAHHRGHFRQVARASGISRSWLSKFACGVRGKRPSYDIIQRLIAALDAVEAQDTTIASSPPLTKPQRANARGADAGKEVWQ